jgi:hypothetical protein
MKSHLTLFALILWLAGPVALAQDDSAPGDPAEPPPIPPVDAREGDVPIPPKVQGEQLQPEVRIRRDEEDNIVEEYRLEGRVYMVKITPKGGIPYYYLDDDGDGTLELQERDRARYPVKPVYWKVKEWN